MLSSHVCRSARLYFLATFRIPVCNQCLVRSGIIRWRPISSTAACKRQQTSTTSEDLKKLKKPDPKDGRFKWQGLIIALVVGGIFLGFFLKFRRDKEIEMERERQRSLGKSKIGGPWELTDHNGTKRSSEDFKGKWYMIYFGFTHCPDVCPDELEKMAEIMNSINSDKNYPNVEGLVFTVDPERDNCDAMKKYVQEFSPQMIGFTGTKEEVEKVCRTFRVYHSQGPKDEYKDYIVDHTIIIYLINPDGQFVDYYSQRRTAEEVATAIRVNVDKYEMVKRH